MPAGVLGQITEEIGELGKHVVAEAAKVPKDVAGKAMESLGVASGKKTQAGTNVAAAGDARAGAREKTPLEEFEQAKDENIKRVIARAALEEIAGVKPKPKEPSVWEKQQMEAKEKKDQAAKNVATQAQTQLPVAKSKRPRGDLFGIKAKRGAAEMSRNVRQD